MNEMYMKDEGVEVFAMEFFIRGDSKLMKDASPIEGISEGAFVVAENIATAYAVADEKMEKVLGMSCEEAGLTIHLNPAISLLRNYQRRHDESEMVMDSLMHVVYQLAGGESIPDHIMGFLDRCDERLGIRGRNYENTCMVESTRKILKGKKEDNDNEG